MDKNMLEQLKKPFKEEEIEWRVQQQGPLKAGVWCMVLAYVQARAIQDRLDDVFGCLGWKDEYCFYDSNNNKNENVICKLSVWDSSKSIWVTKENGAPETQVEAFKGGISSAFKRVASSGYGIGRYLYNLDTNFAETTFDKKTRKDGWNKASIMINNQKKVYYWKTPKLPNWALPK